MRGYLYSKTYTLKPKRGFIFERSEKRRSKAFTLIELLVVIAIIGLLTAAAIPAFSGFTKRQTLAQAAKDLKTELRATQNRTISGVVVVVGSEKRNHWGVHFEGTSSYAIFVTTDSSIYTSDRVRATKQLPANVTISSVFPNVIFDWPTGKAGFYNDTGGLLVGSSMAITLSLSGQVPVNVIVETGGKIYEQ